MVSHMVQTALLVHPPPVVAAAAAPLPPSPSALLLLPPPPPPLHTPARARGQDHLHLLFISSSS